MVKRGRSVYQTELWRLFTSAPIFSLTENLSTLETTFQPGCSHALENFTTPPPSQKKLELLHQVAGRDWLFNWLEIDCELDLCLSQFYMGWSWAPDQGLNRTGMDWLGTWLGLTQTLTRLVFLALSQITELFLRGRGLCQYQRGTSQM